MARQTAIQTTNSNNVPMRSSQPANEGEGWSYVPQIDVLEGTDSFSVVCDAPGLSASDINLTFESGVLHIDGRVAQRYPQDVKFLRQEYGVGDFYRQITLGRLSEFVDGERISADYASGVLTIHMPKLEAARPRKIEVQSN
jgi:HSP20 family protein